MGMGLQAAYGADALQQNLRQRIMDQIAAQQRDRQFQQQQFENDLNTKKFQSGEDIKNANLAAQTESRNAIAEDRRIGLANTLGNQLPSGTEIQPGDQAVGLLQGGGRGALLRGNLTLPSAQTSGAVGLPANPQDETAAPISGTLRTIASPEALRSYTKLPSEQQNVDAAKSALEAAQAKKAEMPPAAKPGRIHDTTKGLVSIADDNTTTPVLGPDGKPVQGYHPPTQAAGDKLTKVEHQDANGKTVIEWLPQSEIKGKTFNKGVSGATETRLASAQAVNQTGDDIVAKLSDPNFAAVVGPAMGRFSSLRDFIGNPPPEFAELAGQIESYALASMGVHGMRSAQGAEKISKLLDAHHTPESLAATIKGLNQFSSHFMQNEGRGGASTSAPAAAPTAKPSAADLIKKYGGD